MYQVACHCYNHRWQPDPPLYSLVYYPVRLLWSVLLLRMLLLPEMLRQLHGLLRSSEGEAT